MGGGCTVDETEAALVAEGDAEERARWAQDLPAGTPARWPSWWLPHRPPPVAAEYKGVDEAEDDWAAEWQGGQVGGLGEVMFDLGGDEGGAWSEGEGEGEGEEEGEGEGEEEG